MQHGCAARGSIARIGESFAFLSSDKRGQGVVIQMNGYSPVRISTNAIENEIQNYIQIKVSYGVAEEEILFCELYK
jgi:hypothetical protein